MGAQNGKKALEILESGPAYLMVADLRMPDMDGFELLAYLNSRFPSIPTIVMCACWTPDLKEKFQAFGTFRFLSKPMDLSEGLKAISESLKKDSKAGFAKGINGTIFLKKRTAQ